MELVGEPARHTNRPPSLFLGGEVALPLLRPHNDLAVVDILALQVHRLVAEPDSETTVYVGAENWPVPFPLVEHNSSWFFDSDLGSREIMFRRIGENEMDATEALRGIIAAENQFDAQNGEYAQHLNCSPGPPRRPLFT
jgi:hypothetical protein